MEKSRPTLGNLSKIGLFFICLLLSLKLGATGLNAIADDFPPLSYSENGIITGYSTELLEAILHSAKLSAPISLAPWARAYQTAVTQPNTLIYSTTQTAERKPLFEWIGPITPRQQIFIYKLRERQDIQVNTLSDSYQYRIGLVREKAATRWLINIKELPQKNIDYAPSTESNLKKLQAQRIDLIVANHWTIAFLIKSGKVRADELEPVILLDNSNHYYFAINKNSDPALIRQLRNAFEAVKKSGQIEKLEQKYLR
jgi:polar amino acid transport system substrate-binding protein